MFARMYIFIFCVCVSGILSCGPSDGAFVDHHPNGKIKKEGFYKEGQKTGNWRYYWKDGTKQVEGSYLKDEPQGQWTFYDEGGRSMARGVYRKGQMWDGQFVRYVLGTKKIIVVKEGQRAN